LHARVHDKRFPPSICVDAHRRANRGGFRTAQRFFTRPVSGVIMARVIAVVLWPLVRRLFAPSVPQQPRQAHY